MRKFNIAILMFLVFILCVSCTLISPRINGNGNIVLNEKTVSTFNRINNVGSAVVRFHKSDEYRVVFSIDSNLVEYVEIVSENSILNIKMKNGGSYSYTEFLVDVYSPVLTSVAISGSGSLTSTDIIETSTFETNVIGSGTIEVTIESENFSSTITGTGIINVTGNSTYANINLSGSGHFNGIDFQIGSATVGISGTGNVNVFVIDNLNVNITGSGRLYYRGDPIINNSTGTDQINKM